MIFHLLLQCMHSADVTSINNDTWDFTYISINYAGSLIPQNVLSEKSGIIIFKQFWGFRCAKAFYINFKI